MDTISIIIGLGFLAIFTVPFLLVRMNNNKKDKEFTQRFLVIAASYGVSISEHETWNRQYAIGLNSDKSQLVYLHVNKEKEESQLIDLTKFSSAKTVRTNKMTATNDEVIDRLELVVSTGSSTHTLEFFNVELVNGLSDELTIIEKWRTIIAGL